MTALSRSIIPCVLILGFVLVFVPSPSNATIDNEQLAGTSSCPTAGQNAADWDTIVECQANSGTWIRGSYFFGAAVNGASETCDANHAGMVQWVNSALEYCDGSNWQTIQFSTGSTGYFVLSKGTYNGCLAQTIAASGLTSSGTTATVHTSAAHNLSTGRLVTIAGASDAKYNLTGVSITVTDTTHFTYTIAAGATSPDVGAPTYCTTEALTAADTICLNELTNNTGWKDYATAHNNGQLIGSKVHAYMADSGTANRFQPSTTYVFENTNDNTAGGASFTTDAYGYGPGDSKNWDTYNTSGTTFKTAATYWTGFYLCNSTTLNCNGSNTNCTDWTTASAGVNGGTGESNFAQASRWYFSTAQACNNTYNLICFVNP
jgi:hypothetical protein